MAREGHSRFSSYAVVFYVLLFFTFVFSSVEAKPYQRALSTDLPVLRVASIKFYWGPGSGAIQMLDHVTDSVLPVPEWNFYVGVNEPACYVRGSNITIEAEFVTNLPVTSCRIWANGSLGGLGEELVTFSNGVSGYVSFKANAPLPNVVSVNNVTWNWWYRDLGGDDTPPIEIEVSSHEVFSVWGTPLDPPIYKSVARWTSEWCSGMGDTDTSKDICDVIISNVHLSGLHYGYPAWTVDDILDTGGGMCGGWYKMFHEMAGDQGVFVYDKCYILKNDAADLPELKWKGIVIKDPGLNNPEPAASARWWYDIDDTYPCPFVTDSDNDIDDMIKVYEKRYIFYSPNDGHCINFLLYDGKVYLYDASFGTGPWPDTFDSIPSGHIYGEDLHDFRANYHDIAIDHMRGTIYYDAGSGCETHYRELDVKSTLIPDLRVPGDPDTYEMHYYWVGTDRGVDSDKRVSGTTNEGDDEEQAGSEADDESYQECMRKVDTVLGEPSTPIDWLAVKEAIMLLGKIGDPRCASSLAKILERQQDLVLTPGAPLPGAMSPLDMLKATAMDTLVKLRVTSYLPQMLQIYYETDNIVLRDVAWRSIQALSGESPL